MAAFILSSATINTMEIRLSGPHGIPSISIRRDPIHYNHAQYITYKISKNKLLQHWENLNLTHIVDWDKIYLTLFKRARETTSVHMSHFITNCTSNALPNMNILQRQGHATTNLCTCCGVTPERIQHVHQCNHGGNHDRWKASVDALRK